MSDPATTTKIESARASDLPQIEALLKRCLLPVEGLQTHFGETFIARDGEKVVACAALEVYQKSALLRSVAVDEEFRDQGLGKRLTLHALTRARELKLEKIYLLTETAQKFFERIGFVAIKRSQVEPDVTQSLEFTTLCCESAQAMVLSLRPR